MTENTLFKFVDDVDEICQQYFNNMGLHFFGHITVYPDGKYNFLCTMREWPKEFIARKIPPAGFTLYDAITDSVRFPSMERGADFGWSDEATRAAKEQFKIQNPMLVLHKFHDHYEGFCFDLHGHNVYEKYLTQFDHFEKFIHYFKERTNKLHHKVMQDPLMVDQQYLPIQSNQHDHVMPFSDELTPKKYFLRHQGHEIILGSKEYCCLARWSHGKTMKEIAEELHISPRTVETHLQRILDKFQLSSKSQLVKAYWENKLISRS